MWLEILFAVIAVVLIFLAGKYARCGGRDV